jgi:hypothetical protein
MKKRSACRCLLCSLESHLKEQLNRGGCEMDFREWAGSSLQLAGFPTALALAAHLRTCHSNGNETHPADGILVELLHGAQTDGAGNLPRDVLLLAFIPALHSTARQIGRRYPLLSADDIAQHLVTSLLEMLQSPELLLRNSHLPFVISRMLKRIGFDWAKRQDRSPTNGTTDEALATVICIDSFDQAVLLRHFLFRCQREGLLTASDVDLLVHIKLEENTGQEPGRLHYSNALRQRIKRLVRKLRHAAQTPPRSTA